MNMRELEFTSAAEASCIGVGLRIDHVLQPHIPFSSLPCPAEPLSITSFPINVRSATSNFNPAAIANLWLQLLVIQIHIGSFIRYGDILEAQGKLQHGNSSNEAGKQPWAGICLSQMSTRQCATLEAAAEQSTRPIDRAVVELLCMLPYATVNGRGKFSIDGQRVMARDPRSSHLGQGSDRGLYSATPNTPLHIVKLTSWQGLENGPVLFVDTRTGQGVVAEDYWADGDYDPDEGFQMEGETGPVEEILEKWINNYLTMKWIPFGADYGEKNEVLHEDSRSMVHLMHKRLGEEYGWPHSFPLPADRFSDFLRRKVEIEEQSSKLYEVSTALSYRWYYLKKDWYENARQDNPDIYKDQLPLTLDTKISECISDYESERDDREYAREANVPVSERFRKLRRLHASTNIGKDWEMVVEPYMIIDRYAEVLAVSTLPGAEDYRAVRIFEILREAYWWYYIREAKIFEITKREQANLVRIAQNQEPDRELLADWQRLQSWLRL